jgi:hypothetical protein
VEVLKCWIFLYRVRKQNEINVTNNVRKQNEEAIHGAITQDCGSLYAEEPFIAFAVQTLNYLLVLNKLRRPHCLIWTPSEIAIEPTVKATCNC